MTPIAYLRDNFTDNIQAGTWGASGTTGSATKAETGGQAVLTLPSSTAGSHSAVYRTSGTYDLTGDAFVWNIGTMVSTSVAAVVTLDVYVDANNILRWQQVSGTITARSVIGGTDTQRSTATWSGTTYKYLRIRESAGTVYWDSSSNGTSWTNRASLGTPFAVTALTVQFSASCENVASPGSLRLDDVNLILPALTTTWHWTQVEWPLIYRFKAITLAANSGQGYIATSNDGTTWIYYSGPIGSSSGGYNSLTVQSTQAAAEAMAVNIPADARWDLPDIVECRFIRIYHRSITGSSYLLREYYPRRLVQSDDIEAESIRAINIAAGAITADKIFVLQLSAITADMGTLTAGTITGGTIQTASSGARVALSSAANGGLIGYSGSDTYDPVAGTGTYQVLWKKTDGKLYAGAGSVILGSDGIRIVDAGTFGNTTAYKFTDSAGSTVYGGLYGHHNIGAPRISLQTDDIANATIMINANAIAGGSGFATLQAQITSGNTVKIDIKAGATGDQITMSGPSTTGTLVDMFAMLDAHGGINVGTATGASTGQINTSDRISTTVNDAGTTTIPDVLMINHNSSATPANGFGSAARWQLETSSTPDTSAAQINVSWANATHASRRALMDFYVYDAAAAQLFLRGEATGGSIKIGFLGATPQLKTTVTGSRAGNAALASLLTALANFGLVIDSSS